MKNLIVLFAILFSIGVSAQSKKTHTVKKQAVKTHISKAAVSVSPKQQNSNPIPIKPTEADFVAMKNGKIIIIKGDRSNELTSPITLKNGMVISPDGKMTMTKDGSVKMMREGDMIDRKGNNTSESQSMKSEIQMP